MLKLFSDASRRLHFLLRESQETRVKIGEISEKLQQVTTKVQALTVELEQERETARRDWEKIAVLVQQLQAAVEARSSKIEPQTQNRQNLGDSR